MLFDGVDLGDWRVGVFTGADEFDLAKDGVVLPQTTALAGMTYVGEPPMTPYTLRIDATKRYGGDFFLGVTFPVRGEHLTLVLGGWGGSVTGLSCLDGLDAAENDTMTHRHYPNGKRFRVELRVTDGRVTALVDDDVVVDASLEARVLGLRPEVLASRPLGLASYATSTVVHRVTWTPGAAR